MDRRFSFLCLFASILFASSACGGSKSAADTAPEETTNPCADVTCEHAPICGQMSADYSCGCTCTPGNIGCGDYQGQTLVLTCRSDGACLMPEACAPGQACEMLGPAVAGCVAIGGVDAGPTEDGSSGCSAECSETSLCSVPEDERCDCPCMTENEYCLISDEGNFTIVCSEDRSCFEKIACTGETVCNDDDETGASCGEDPRTPVCPGGQCVPPAPCGEEPQEGPCPICPCDTGDQICTVEAGTASILTCDQEAQCVTSIACATGDSCIPTGNGTAQCSSNLTSCEDLAAAYTFVATDHTSCTDDDDCIYQWGKCDIGFTECYFSINWQSIDLLQDIYQYYLFQGCPLEPICSGCGPEPIGGVCTDGVCTPKYADSPAP